MMNEPVYDEQQRAAQLFQQRTARSAQQPAFAQHMSQQPAPQERRVRFDPRLQQPMNMPSAAPTPSPSGIIPTNKITGTGPGYIPKKDDPTSKYNSISEKQGGLAPSGEYDGIKHVVRLIIVALFVAAIFVVPMAYRPFWIIITSLVVLCGICFQLYIEWDAKAFSGSDEEREDSGAKGWAGSLLYLVTMGTSAVVVGILMVMIWKVYCVARANTNLFGEDTSSGYETPVVEPTPSAPQFQPQYHDPVDTPLEFERKRSRRHSRR